MDGRIWVESVAGRGSTFHFHARFGLQSEPMPRRMFRADELAGVRALVVDDNAAAREILSMMARSFGLEVDVAENGRQALEMLAAADRRHAPYDVALMDWRMPEMDGVEAIRHLHDDAALHTPTVIMVTAYGRAEAVGAAEASGVAPYSVLTKPVTPSTLLESVAEALGKGVVTESRASASAEQDAAIQARLVGARVLLVEDNEMNQELAIELLRSAGMAVELAENGQAALDFLARDAAVDGVLMDCQMPVMDGFQATRAIRDDPRWRDLPVIAMTANTMAGDREKVLEAGMNDHIAKPFNVSEMFATLAKWIKPGKDGTIGERTACSETYQFPPLAGIDTRAGLATTMQNPKLYLRLLRKFRDTQVDFAQQFDAARSDTDPDTALRLAHTLYGTAGNIGARNVQAAAQALELACGKGDVEEVNARLEATLAALAPVLEGLRTLGTEEALPMAASSATVDKPRIAALLAQLRHALDDSDSQAVDVLDELAPLVEGTPLARDLKDVARHIEAYDFDAALEAMPSAAILH